MLISEVSVRSLKKYSKFRYKDKTFIRLSYVRSLGLYRCQLLSLPYTQYGFDGSTIVLRYSYES